MSKSVTKLIEAGDVLLNGPSSATWAAFESAMSEFLLAPDYDEPNVELLEVLDLVASLPAARLEALKEWLNEKPICPECCHRIGNPSDHSPGCVEGSNRSESGETIEAPRDKISAEDIEELESRLSEVRAKIVSYDGGDRPSSPPVAMLREEDDLRARLREIKGKPKPTILPAGKSPPFLRVGMVLRSPDSGLRWRVRSIQEPAAYVEDPSDDDFAGGWMETAELLTWPLAETFTVEEES